jgi:hypothetical protein
MRVLALTFASLGLLALAAAQRPLPHPIDPSPEWQRAVENGTRTAGGRPGTAMWRNTASYVLSAQLDPTTARVQGRVRATYHNRSPHELGSLVLHLRQNLHAPDAVRNIAVEVTGGMQLDDVTIDGQPAETERRGTVLEVGLRGPLLPGKDAVFEASFAFTVPEGEAPRMGREGHSLYFLGYWYPQFAVLDDVRGWVAEPYLGESEFYMPYADYEVAFTAPVGWLVAATGELQNPDEVLTEKARTALAAAKQSRRSVPIVSKQDLDAGEATALATNEQRTQTWRFAAQNVRDVAIATGNGYVWDAALAEVGDRDGDGTADQALVHAFYRPRARSWRRAAEFAQHAIERLSHHVLPYPYPHATVVEGILGGGMEYPMLTLCGDQRVPMANQSLIAHELAHMWFPMIVGNNETRSGWQDEGLVEFFTAILEREFWQRTRPGAIRELAATQALGLDREPMLRHADHLEHPESYVLLCYTKPCAVLQQLAGLFGEDRVIAALRGYARAWQFLHPEPEDFFAMMNAGLGEDLGWYWSTWWTTTWRLDHAIGGVEVTDGEAASTKVTIHDLGRAPHPVVVRATFADGKTAERTVPVATWLGGKITAEVTFEGAAVRIELDPEARTVDCDRANNVWTNDK